MSAAPLVCSEAGRLRQTAPAGHLRMPGAGRLCGHDHHRHCRSHDASIRERQANYDGRHEHVGAGRRLHRSVGYTTFSAPPGDGGSGLGSELGTGLVSFSRLTTCSSIANATDLDDLCIQMSFVLFTSYQIVNSQAYHLKWRRLRLMHLCRSVDVRT